MRFKSEMLPRSAAKAWNYPYGQNIFSSNSNTLGQIEHISFLPNELKKNWIQAKNEKVASLGLTLNVRS